MKCSLAVKTFAVMNLLVLNVEQDSLFKTELKKLTCPDPNPPSLESTIQ